MQHCNCFHPVVYLVNSSGPSGSMPAVMLIEVVHYPFLFMVFAFETRQNLDSVFTLVCLALQLLPSLL